MLAGKAGPISGGSHAGRLFKQLGKMLGVLEADQAGDCGDFVRGLDQHLAGNFDSIQIEIEDGRCIEAALENPVQVRGADKNLGSQGVHVDFLGKMLLDELHALFGDVDVGSLVFVGQAFHDADEQADQVAENLRLEWIGMMVFIMNALEQPAQETLVILELEQVVKGERRFTFEMQADDGLVVARVEVFLMKDPVRVDDQLEQ